MPIPGAVILPHPPVILPAVGCGREREIRATAAACRAAAKQAGMSIGHKGMLYAARCMAEGTKLLTETPGALEKVWEFHRRDK